MVWKLLNSENEKKRLNIYLHWLTQNASFYVFLTTLLTFSPMISYNVEPYFAALGLLWLLSMWYIELVILTTSFRNWWGKR